MIRLRLLALSLGLAISVMPLAAVAHEGHDHRAKAKKVKKSKPKKAAIRLGVMRAPGWHAGSRLRVGVAPEEIRNCLVGFNHSLSFLSHYSPRPASGRRVAPVHSV
jgi:hypothetical protein